MQRAQGKIEMGIKRRAELLTEETVLKKNLKELEEGNWGSFLVLVYLLYRVSLKHLFSKYN